MPISVGLVDQLKRVRVMRCKQFVMLTALLVGATHTTAIAQQGVGGALSARQRFLIYPPLYNKTPRHSRGPSAPLARFQ